MTETYRNPLYTPVPYDTKHCCVQLIDRAQAMEKPNPQPVKLEGCLSQIWNFSTGELLNTTQKHNCSDYGCPVLTIATIVLRICTEIENLKLRACIQVLDYINNTKMEQIIRTMVKSIHKSFQEYISGIKNGFIDLKYIFRIHFVLG